MSYFPAFLNINDKKILIVGAGNIAFNKLEHLLEFTNDITIISLDFNSNISSLIEKNSLFFKTKAYETSDLQGFDIVIAAVDNIQIQEQIYKDSRGLNCLCNCVDLPACCDFIFPSYIKKGDLTIAISTSGSSPSLAKHLKIWLDNSIPNSIVDFLNKMKEYRKTMPKGKKRMEFFDKEVKSYMNTWKKKK